MTDIIRYENPQTALRAINERMVNTGNRWPDKTLGIILDAITAGIPPNIIPKAMEALYAVKDELDDNTLTLCARLFETAKFYSWAGVFASGRADQVILSLRRDIARVGGELRPRPEGGEWPTTEQDPTPVFEYTIIEEEPEV